MASDSRRSNHVATSTKLARPKAAATRNKASGIEPTTTDAALPIRGKAGAKTTFDCCPGW